MRRRMLLMGGAAFAVGGAGLAWRGTTGSMEGYAAEMGRLRAAPAPQAGMVELIRIAGLASSGHNTQPWIFRLCRGAVDILPDRTRRTAASDPDGHHLHVSLGAAAETLATAGPAFGRPGALTTREDGSLRYEFSDRAARRGSALATILRRQSARAEYDGRMPPTEELDALVAAAAAPGVRVVLIADRLRLDQLHDLIAEGNRAQFGDPAFLAELFGWIRFNPRAALRQGDGLFAPTLGAPVTPEAFGRLLFARFATAESENDKLERWMASTPVMAAFFAEEPTPRGWALVGRALTRFVLAATERGLKTAHLNQAVEVAALRPALAALAGEPGLRPDLVLRLGYGPEMPYAPRRPVGEILT